MTHSLLGDVDVASLQKHGEEVNDAVRVGALILDDDDVVTKTREETRDDVKAAFLLALCNKEKQAMLVLSISAMIL